MRRNRVAPIDPPPPPPPAASDPYMLTATYARTSTDQNGVAGEQKSVARQTAQARRYATAKGWHVADEHVYVDDGIWRRVREPAGLLRLMNALKPGRRSTRS